MAQQGANLSSVWTALTFGPNWWIILLRHWSQTTSAQEKSLLPLRLPGLMSPSDS